MSGRVVRWGLALAVLVAALGLLAPQLIRSPAQVAAERAAPDLPPATAEVERRVLTSTVMVRGTVTRAQRAEVQPVAPVGGRAVVTAVRVREGAKVPAGRVLVEVSGHPVILLPGRLPAYRDLRTGHVGPDVEQLQQALRAVGYSVGDEAGRFGSGTTAAVRALYRDRGYDPPGSKAAALLPVAEVAFLDGLPARVDRLDAKVGSEATESLMTLSSGKVVVNATLPVGDRALVRVGQEARLRSELLDVDLKGEVASIGRLGGGEGPPGHPLVVEPRGKVPPRLFDREVRITIAAAETRRPVLVVPLSAVTARADGSSVVTVIGSVGQGDGDGDESEDDKPDRDGAGGRDVPVRLGLVADGSVAVRPIDGGRLADGDLVVVGARPATAP